MIETVETKSVARPPSTYTEFEKLNWITTKAIPQIGAEVCVKINSIGRSIVKKYFVEHGFIGLLVQPLSPPDWYVKQNGADEPCHVFPAECLELEVRGEDGKVDSEFYNKALAEKA